MRRAAAILLLLVCCSLAVSWGQELDKSRLVEPEPRPFSFWMDAKLEQSQKVFAALSRADFETIRKATSELEMLSTFEGFVRRSTPGYLTHLRSFEFAVREMNRQATQGNLEGVALGFNQLTVSCVNCHKAIREAGEGPIPH